MADNGGRSGRAYLRLREWCFRTYTTCARCGEYVDQTIHLVDPRHPRARSMGHIVPLAHGGAKLDPANVQLEHYGCNSGAAAKLGTGVAEPPYPPTHPLGMGPGSAPSRTW